MNGIDADQSRNGCSWVVLVLILMVAVGYCAALWAHSEAVKPVCKALGWQKGTSKGWFTGLCYENSKWQYHDCNLEYVLAGACEPMWPDAE